MRTWLRSPTTRAARARDFLAANAGFCDELVGELAARGPLRARDLEDRSAEPWRHGWWTDEVSGRQTIARLLHLLWMTGRIGVGQRVAGERLWDVFERCVPPGAAAAAVELDDDAAERAAVLRAVRMLGVARPAHVRAHFLRRRYPRLADVLDALAGDGRLQRVTVQGLRGDWYAAPEDLAGAGELAPGARTTALSPFDNLLCDRARAAELFGFDHRLEIYVPAAQRRWGYYVLPILHRERLVARADAVLDRDAGLLRVNALYVAIRPAAHAGARSRGRQGARAARGLAGRDRRRDGLLTPEGRPQRGGGLKIGPATPDPFVAVPAMPAPALVLDEHGVVVDANDLAVELLREPVATLAGRTVADVVEGYGPDGTPVRLRTLRSRQIDGTTLCLLRVVTGDELVDDLVSYFDAAFDHAPIGMAIIGAEGRYIRVNDALCAMLGRPRDVLVGARDNEITHPDDRENDVELAWKILRGELDSVQLQKRFVKPDGTVVWVISNMTYLRDDDGAGIAWVGQWQDVTAHREVEFALRRERDLSAAMLAAMHEGFCLVQNGRVLQVNDAMSELVGWTREELVGCEWPFPWVPEEQFEHQAATRIRWLAEGQGEGDDFVLRRKDGSRFDAAITTAQAAGPDGESLGFVVTVRDISERKLHEAELARLATHDTLTGLVNHRGFHERLREEIARCRRKDDVLSLVILDLDQFKQVNDTYGHPVGDRVLAEVGRRFRGLMRLGEHVARIGGEEFAWILSATDAAGAYAAAERARRAIEREPFEGVGHLTISAGVCDLDEAADADELHRLADVALYWAKNHGRNIVFRYSPETAAHLAQQSDPRAEASEHGLRLRALHAVARMVEHGHQTSDGHAERVADLAAAIARRLGWREADVRALREAGVLHDVGKIVLPKSVLLKPGPFSEDEWAQMRRHPVIGDGMLEGVLSDLQRSWVRGHHERWDGGGYPDALAGEEIAEGARILAVADSWDVMTSTRIYSRALSAKEATEELHRGAGRQFDPAVVDALVGLHAQRSSSAAGAG